jgi:hypothetical protein
MGHSLILKQEKVMHSDFYEKSADIFQVLLRETNFILCMALCRVCERFKINFQLFRVAVTACK